MLSTTMRHTRLTSTNFGQLVTTNLLLGLLFYGFGAADMIMVASFGSAHLAAIGLGELIVTTAFAILSGYADLYATTLARQVGVGDQKTLLRTNFMFAVTAIGLIGLFAGAALVVGTVLRAIYTDGTIGELTGTYVAVRFLGVGLHLMSFGLIEALKIRGFKRLAFLPVSLGFAVNIAGNYAVLHTPAGALSQSLMAGIALTTVLAQLVMVLSTWVVWIKLPVLNDRDIAPPLIFKLRDTWRFIVAGFGIGSRNLNDYISNLAPLLLIGTVGPERAAAAAVAAKLATLFYRVPQSCFGASLIFYSFTLNRFSRHPGRARRLRLRRLVFYSAVPTALFALLFFFFLESLAQLSSNSADAVEGALLLTAYLVFVPVYFLEQFFAELIAAHHQDMVMLWPSTLVTFALALPLAYVSAIYLQSAFLAIASRGVAAIPLAGYYWYCLKPHLFETDAEPT